MSPDYQTLQAQVLAIVLGNLLTLVILLIVYCNGLVFSHYGSELIYAVLLSEALFSTRQRLVVSLKHYTGIASGFSPREMVFTTFSTVRGYGRLVLWILLARLFSHSLEGPIVLVYSTAWLFALFDTRLLWVFRLHHALRVSDETLVSLFICFVMLASVFVFLGSFLLLAMQDMAQAVDSFARYADLFEDDQVRQKLNATLVLGRSHIDSIASSLSQQYESTPYRMAIKLTADLLSNMTRKLEHSSQAGSGNTGGWSGINPQVLFDENLKDQVWSLSLSALYNSSALFPQAANVLISPLYLVVAFCVSMGVAFLDFGVRAGLFAGVLVFLVSHPKSVLQSVMESLLGVFHTASSRARTNSASMMVGADSFLGSVEGEGVEDEARAKELEATRLAFKRFEDDLRSTFRAVFLVPISLAGCNAVATLGLFSVFNLVFGAGLNLAYFASLVSLFLTLIPVLSPFVSCVPWAIVCGAVQGRYWTAFALLLSHFLLFQWIDVRMVAALHVKPGHHGKRARNEFRSYLTGLSFFFGITSMGLHGVVLGPLFVSFFYTTASTVLDQYRDVIQTNV